MYSFLIITFKQILWLFIIYIIITVKKPGLFSPLICYIKYQDLVEKWSLIANEYFVYQGLALEHIYPPPLHHTDCWLDWWQETVGIQGTEIKKIYIVIIEENERVKSNQSCNHPR